MSHVIRVENLSKYYKTVHAVDGLNLEINQGEIYGFLGLNGAGKTTTIRMLLGMIIPTRGSAYLFGEKVRAGNGALWNRVGHLVEIPYSYPELTVQENLEIFYRLRFIKDANRLPEIIALLKLDRYRHTKAKNLSLGNAQRLGIAKAMIHKPQLLILDEPANGLDPEGIVEIRELLIDLAKNSGVTIFISSHILGEISRIASRIGIIHDGVILKETTADHLDKSRFRTLHIDTTDNEAALKVLKKQGFLVNTLTNGILEVHGDDAIRHPDMVSGLLCAAGLHQKDLHIDEEDLEHYFLRIVHNHNKSL